MLRKQENEFEQLQIQVTELTKEVNELKLQLKSDKTEKVNSNQVNSDYRFGNKIGKEIGKMAITKGSLNDKFSSKQIYKLFSNLMNSQINIPNSFGLSKNQLHYQQAQSLKNISYKF